MTSKLIVILVIITLWNQIECQLGQFGFPFVNNVNQNAQSSFNPQSRQGSFTFGGGDWVFPNLDVNFNNPWTPQPRPNKPPPNNYYNNNNYNYNNNNNNRPSNNQNTQYRPQPVAATTTTTTTRRPQSSVLQANRVGGRISQTSMNLC